jgi:hypothetical protein
MLTVRDFRRMTLSFGEALTFAWQLAMQLPPPRTSKAKPKSKRR